MLVTHRLEEPEALTDRVAIIDRGKRLRVTPASRLALLLGPVLREVVMFVVPALLVILLAEPFGYNPDWGGIAVLFVLLSLLTALVSAWSNALGMVLKEIGSLAVIVTGLQLPPTLLSGVLLALSIARPTGCGSSHTSTRSTTPSPRRASLRRHDRHRGCG